MPQKPWKRRQLLKNILQASAVTGAGLIGAKFIPGWLEKPIDPLFPLDLLSPFHPLPDHLLTPVGDFYVQSYGMPPAIALENWRLEIKGKVKTPLTLTFADILKASPQEDFYLTMECIGNPTGGNLIGNARWTGTPLLPFLEQAGVSPDAEQFILHGADSYETNLPVADVMRPEVRLVHRMNGEPLTQNHGYPLRIILPGHFGQKQPKWLIGIEAVSGQKRGYWERQGWSNTAHIPTHALTRQVQTQRVWNRQHQVSLPQMGEIGWAKGILVAGVALDGYNAIQHVWVSTNNGKTWKKAEKNSPSSPHEWTLWRYPWKPTQPGNYTLLARAESATTQQPLEDNNWRDGSSGILRIQVRLV
ncbi:MAG: molybdopterin-dependent oxidoreductase [Leptolyngbyaceae bacterium]|nr:molybdopterin-dependent oxidoreductase [Leptolyngbyaceae bacterium]